MTIRRKMTNQKSFQGFWDTEGRCFFAVLIFFEPGVNADRMRDRKNTAAPDRRLMHKRFEITGVRGAEQTKDISNKPMLVNNSIRAIPQVRFGLI